jgi:HTH-type transcriptional regulator / antitoxin HigA
MENWTPEDYKKAKLRLDEIFFADENTPEGREAQVLVDQICGYEEKCHPIGLPGPVEAIKCRMEDLGLRHADLAVMAGISRSEMSLILTKRRRLTIPVIRGIHDKLGLPLEVLIQDYELKK